MSEQQRKGRGAVEMGPTSATVAANVRRTRERRGLSTYQLSGQLQKAGRPISPSAISKLERGDRQVTVDDLVALAAVLRVSPSALLLPLDDSPTNTVEITGGGSVAADVAWDWLDGKRPLKRTEGDKSADMLEHELYSRPPGRRARLANVADELAVIRKRQVELGLPPHEWPPGLIQPLDGD